MISGERKERKKNEWNKEVRARQLPMLIEDIRKERRWILQDKVYAMWGGVLMIELVIGIGMIVFLYWLGGVWLPDHETKVIEDE